MKNGQSIHPAEKYGRMRELPGKIKNFNKKNKIPIRNPDKIQHFSMEKIPNKDTDFNPIVQLKYWLISFFIIIFYQLKMKNYSCPPLLL